MSDGPVDIATFGDLIKHSYTLTGYCPKCAGPGRRLDLAKMPRDQDYVGRRFTCKDCGSRMDMILSPEWSPWA